MNRLRNPAALVRYAKDQAAFVRHYLRRRLPVAGLRESLERYRQVRQLHAMEVGEFFLYRLWRPELTREQWSAFIGWKKHIAALQSLNPLPYRCLTENKLIFCLYCKGAGVPTPRVHAVLDPTRTVDAAIPTLRDVAELPAFLDREGITDFVIKPANGTRGQAISVLRRDAGGGIATADGHGITLEELRRIVHYEFRGTADRTFLVQERLLPHDCTKELSGFCPFSYRVITLIDDQGKPHILFTYAKLATGDSLSDNLHAGGLALLADQQGRCLGARSKKSFDTLTMRHPSRDFKLEGWELPFFHDVRAVAVKAAAEFSLVRVVAWDIAVSRQGIMLFEGNNPWNKDIQEVYDAGLWQGVFASETAKAFRNPASLPPWW